MGRFEKSIDVVFVINLLPNDFENNGDTLRFRFFNEVKMTATFAPPFADLNPFKHNTYYPLWSTISELVQNDGTDKNN